MKILLVLAIAFSAVRSEAGYNYQQPPVIFEAKNSAFNTQQSSSSSGYQYQPPIVENFKDSIQSTGYNYQPPVVQDLGFNSQGFASSSAQSNSLSHSSFDDYSYPLTNHAPIVQKHVYVHVAPEEPQLFSHRSGPILPPPQKHYKIIFIKAPTPPTYSAPIIPLQPQNEEKTLVYVLVKKPEEQPDVFIPSAPVTPPSKPEVFFIKYRTQKETVGRPVDDIPIGPGIINNVPAFVSDRPSFDDNIIVNNPTRQQFDGFHSGGSINLQSGGLQSGGSINLQPGSFSSGGSINLQSGRLPQGGSINLQSGRLPSGGSINLQPGSFSSGGSINLQSGRLPQGGSINLQSGRLPSGGSINLQSGRLPSDGSINLQSGRFPSGGSINLQSGRLPSGGSINLQSGRFPSGGSINLQPGRLPSGGSINLQSGRFPSGGSINLQSGRTPSGGSVNLQSGRLPSGQSINLQSEGIQSGGFQSGDSVVSEGLSGVIPTTGSFSSVSSFTSESSSTQGLDGRDDLTDFSLPTVSGPTTGSTSSGLTLASSTLASESDDIQSSSKAPLSTNYGVPSK